MGPTASSIHMELVGPITPSQGYTHILTITDAFTQYTELIPISNKQTTTAAKALLDEWMLRHGFYEQVVSDRYLKIYYYNTLTEWINLIPSLRLALNTRIHNSTRMSPYFMACMEHPSFPWPQDMHLSYSESDVMSEARPLNHARGLILSESDGARAANKGAYDSKTKTQRFEPGEKVILHYPSPPEGTNRKLYPPWKGAYKVIHKFDDLIYKLRKRGGRMETAHIDRIRDNLPPPIDRYTSANQNLAIATNRQKPVI